MKDRLCIYEQKGELYAVSIRFEGSQLIKLENFTELMDVVNMDYFKS